MKVHENIRQIKLDGIIGYLDGECDDNAPLLSGSIDKNEKATTAVIN
jgi:hypothetical protein